MANGTSAYPLDTSAHLFEFRSRGSSVVLYVDGASFGASAVPPALVGGTWTPHVGCYAPDTLSQGVDTDVGPVVLLDGTATDTEVEQVRAYLLA